MPHVHPRPENHRNASARSDGARGQRVRDEQPMPLNPPFAAVGTQSMKAGLRMQQEMFDVFQDIGRGWFARAASEAEWALRLPNKLTVVRTLPGAVAAYQEWWGEWMSMRSEDGRRLLADSRKIMDVSARCFSETASKAA